MSDKLIPEATQLAAKRAFLRTGSQSLATSALLGGGLTLAYTGDALAALGVAVGSAIVTAVANGAQAYFSMISKGIPEEYVDAGTEV